MAHADSLSKMEQVFRAVEELVAYGNEAAQEGIAAHVAEENIFRKVLEIGRTAMQRFLTSQGDGDLGEKIETPEGKSLTRLEQPRRRAYVSVFGRFEIERRVYGAREGQKIEFAPLDARLSLPESIFSYLLQDWDQMLAAEEPFQKVSSCLQRILGLEQHVDNLERMSRAMTFDADMFCWEQEPPEPDEEGEILVETADGKGVPMRRPADAPPIHDHQHRCGPKADRKKMATLGSVYTVDRHRRSAEEIVAALFAKPKERPKQPTETRDRPPRPRPCHKRVYARLTCEDSDGEEIDGPLAVFGWMHEQVCSRNPKGEKPLVCIMDGQISLWTTKEVFQSEVPMVEILDLLHVTPRLWDAANLLCGTGTKQAERLVRRHLLAILKGGVRSVMRGLRRMATTRRLSQRGRSRIDEIRGYFQKNADRMRYDEYLQQGFPIASGVIEGACRHVVKDRLERSGMSWTPIGAQAMLLQRAIYTNGDWDTFMHHRIRCETERLYQNRKILDEKAWSLAT